MKKTKEVKVCCDKCFMKGTITYNTGNKKSFNGCSFSDCECHKPSPPSPKEVNLGYQGLLRRRLPISKEIDTQIFGGKCIHGIPSSLCSRGHSEDPEPKEVCNCKPCYHLEKQNFDEGERCVKCHFRRGDCPVHSPKEGKEPMIINRTAMDCDERHCHCHDEELGRTICTSDFTTCHHCHPELYKTAPAKESGEWEKEFRVRLTYLDLPKKYHQGLINYVQSLLLHQQQEFEGYIGKDEKLGKHDECDTVSWNNNGYYFCSGHNEVVEKGWDAKRPGRNEFRAELRAKIRKGDSLSIKGKSE